MINGNHTNTNNKIRVDRNAAGEQKKSYVSDLAHAALNAGEEVTILVRRQKQHKWRGCVVKNHSATLAGLGEGACCHARRQKSG